MPHLVKKPGKRFNPRRRGRVAECIGTPFPAGFATMLSSHGPLLVVISKEGEGIWG